MTEQTTDSGIEYDEYLDAKGLNCPLPILKTKVLLNRMEPGKILFIEATDPHSTVDFEAYCARTKHRLLSSTSTTGDIFCFYIECSDNPNKI